MCELSEYRVWSISIRWIGSPYSNPAPPINLHVSNYEFVSHGVLSLMKWKTRTKKKQEKKKYAHRIALYKYIHTDILTIYIHNINLDELFLYTIFSKTKRNFF